MVGGVLARRFRHDGGDLVGGFGQRLRKQRERAAEAEDDLLVVRCRKLVRGGHQRLAEGVLGPPAAQAGDHVARQHRGVVVEQQAVAQGQRPQLLVGIKRVAGQHLVLRDPLGIEGEQGVEHHHDVVAGDEGAGQRVDQGEVGVGDEFQRGGGGGADNGRAGDASGQGRSGGAGDKLASFHAGGLW